MLTDSVSRVHIPLSFTTCTLPANVSFSLCSTDVDYITLNWNKVSKATGYQVEMYTNGKWKTLSTLSGNELHRKRSFTEHSVSFQSESHKIL